MVLNFNTGNAFIPVDILPLPITRTNSQTSRNQRDIEQEQQAARADISLATQCRELPRIFNGWSSHIAVGVACKSSSCTTATTPTTTTIVPLPFSWLQELIYADRLQPNKQSNISSTKLEWNILLQHLHQVIFFVFFLLVSIYTRSLPHKSRFQFNERA